MTDVKWFGCNCSKSELMSEVEQKLPVNYDLVMMPFDVKCCFKERRQKHFFFHVEKQEIGLLIFFIFIFGGMPGGN